MRGFRISLLASDGFSKLLAVGLDLRLRPADLHHRRRDPADHPAHRDHASLRLTTGDRAWSPTSSCSRCSCSSRTGPTRSGGSSEPRHHARRDRRARPARALIVGTTYWQVWASSSLAAKQDNAIQRVAQFTVRRGKIEGSAGKTIYATNLRRKVKGQTLYFRKYPNLGMLAQTVGYSTQERSRTGLESSLNDYLTGTNANLNTVLKTNLDRLQGITVTGNNVFLTVDPRGQRIAQGALGTQCGAVFALEPSTGKVLVAASSPTFDLNLAESRISSPTSARSTRTAGPPRRSSTAGRTRSSPRARASRW